ncbi:hypothetical protein BDE02_11G050000 [Populus trichocarpa]|nr:hypothetical protein BDE02_11G050000 [Populus trichocarpa]
MRQTCQRVQNMCHHYVPVPVPAVFQALLFVSNLTTRRPHESILYLLIIYQHY